MKYFIRFYGAVKLEIYGSFTLETGYANCAEKPTITKNPNVLELRYSKSNPGFIFIFPCLGNMSVKNG